MTHHWPSDLREGQDLCLSACRTKKAQDGSYMNPLKHNMSLIKYWIQAPVSLLFSFTVW